MKTFDFTENILFLGMVAKIYAELDYDSPIHSWAARVPNRELMVGNDLYRFGGARHVIDGTEHNGVQLTRVKDGVQESFFFPITNLRTTSFSLEGIQL